MDGGTFPLAVGTEENSRPKDALKCCYEAPVLGATLLHAEGVEHLRRAVERNQRSGNSTAKTSTSISGKSGGGASTALGMRFSLMTNPTHRTS
jgi:hypothetical protein